MIVIKYRNKNFSPLQKKRIHASSSFSLCSPIYTSVFTYSGIANFTEFYKAHRIYTTINTKSTKYQ